MLTPPSVDPQPPLDNDPAAVLLAFTREMFCGGLRWLATVFAIGGVILLGGMYADIVPVETYWPVRTRGTTAAVLAVFLFGFWTVVAVVNWCCYAKRRRGHSLGRPAPSR